MSSPLFASPAVNSKISRTPKTAPRSKTMSVEESNYIRVNQSLNIGHSNDIAEENVQPGSLTPRRSTRITAKVAITPSMEMPPPKTFNSTATKRRKTTVAGPSASKKSAALSDEVSGTPTVPAARKARRTLNIDVQSDSANESDNMNASESRSRSKKSKSVRAVKEASNIDINIEAGSSNMSNGKFVKAPNFDVNDVEVNPSPAKVNRSIIVAMAISRHQSETDDFQTAEESDSTPSKESKVQAGKSKKRNYVSLLPSEVAKVIPAPSSAKSDRNKNNISLNAVANGQSGEGEQNKVSDDVEVKSVGQEGIVEEQIEHTDENNDMVTVRNRDRKTFAEIPAASLGPRPRRNYASLANENVPITTSPKPKDSDETSTGTVVEVTPCDNLTEEEEKNLVPEAISSVSLNKSKNTSTVSLNKSNRSQKNKSTVEMTDDEDDVLPEAASSISSNKSNKDNISGIAALTDDEDDIVAERPSRNSTSVAPVNNAVEKNTIQPLPNIPMITVDLTESLVEDSAERDHALNVTFSPIAERAEPTTSVMENSMATAFDHSKMRRIASTPKVPSGRVALGVPLTPMSTIKTPLKRLQAKSPRNSDVIPKAEDSRTSGRRGTPYMRKVSHANMASVANTKVFSTAKKEKILIEAQTMTQKRVTFNRSVVLDSAIKKDDKKGIDKASATASTSGSTVKLPLKGVSIQEAKRKKQEARNLKKNPIATSVAGPSNTPSSTVTLGSVKKTQMPDFKSIFQRDFQKMESLDECARRHEERKAAISARKENHASIATGAIPKKTVVRNLNVQVATVQPLARKVLQPSHINATMPVDRKEKTVILPKKRLNETTEAKQDRRQAMFKGRAPVAPRVKQGQMLRGVRTNRRFELQMKYRKEHPED